MKVRLSLIALLSALAVPAMASSGFTPGRGEASFKTHPMASTKTRDQVKRELEAWKRNPVSADGWREVGGEAGWIFEGSDGTAKSRRCAKRLSRRVGIRFRQMAGWTWGVKQGGCTLAAVHRSVGNELR
jgi:hypothetical protein